MPTTPAGDGPPIPILDLELAPADASNALLEAYKKDVPLCNSGIMSASKRRSTSHEREALRR